MRHIIALHCIANIYVYLPPENVPSLRLSASIFRILCVSGVSPWTKPWLETSYDCLAFSISWFKTQEIAAGGRVEVYPVMDDHQMPKPAPQVTPAGHWVPILGEGGAGSSLILLLQKPLYSYLFMLHHCQNICIEIWQLSCNSRESWLQYTGTG